MTTSLLVVDFDYFFPMDLEGENWSLYDWGHSESLFMIHDIWVPRAVPFLNRGMELPGLSGAQRKFWDRFMFTTDCRMFVGESNTFAGSVEVQNEVYPYLSQVWLFDQHHDSGYSREYEEYLNDRRFSCEDWMYVYHEMDAHLTVRYPEWMGPEVPPWAGEPKIPYVDVQIDDGKEVDVEFDAVFVCRSGAWVPPWHDEAFIDFVDRGPGTEMIVLGQEQVDPMTPRHWDIEDVHQMLDSMRRIEPSL